jgi:hypothetical protein
MELYIFGEFRDIQNRLYTVQIFEDTDSTIEFKEFNTFGAQPLLVEHTAQPEDNFSRIITSQAKIQFIATTEEEAQWILDLQTSLNTFFVRIDRQGELFYAGKVLQDLGEEKNSPLPRLYTIEVRDNINELFKRSSEDLKGTGQTLFNLEAMTLPRIWARALNLMKIEDYGEIKIKSHMTWTNENNRTGGWALNRNYINTYFVFFPLCLVSGQEEKRVLARFGEVYGEFGQTGVYDSGQAAAIVKQNKYYTIGEIMASLLEALDLVFFYDAGVYWFVQREAWVSNSWYVSTVTDEHAISNVPPLYGAESASTVNYNFTPQDVYSQGLFTGMQRAYKLRHFFTNQKDPVYDELIRKPGSTPFDFFWIHNQFTIPNGQTEPGIFLRDVNEASFDAAKVVIDIDIEIDRWTNNFFAELVFFARIYTSNGQSWDGRAWRNTANFSFPFGNIRPFGQSTSGGSFNRRVEFLIPPPDGVTFTDLLIEIKAQPGFSSNTPTLNSVLDNRAGTFNLIRGSVSAEEVAGGTINAGGLLFEQVANENINAQTVMDRGNLLFENSRPIKGQFNINTLINNGTPLLAPETAGFLEGWRRLNNTPDRTLANLRGFEMISAVRRVQKLLDLTFRFQPNYIGFEQPMVNLYGSNWRFINRTFDAKKSQYTGRLLEAVRLIGSGTFTGNPMVERSERTSSIVDGSMGGQLGGGRLAGDSFTTLAQSIQVADEVSEISVTPTPFAIPAGVRMVVYSQTGYQVGSFILGASVDEDETTIVVSEFTRVASISEGYYLVIEQKELMRILFSSIG